MDDNLIRNKLVYLIKRFTSEIFSESGVQYIEDSLGKDLPRLIESAPFTTFLFCLMLFDMNKMQPIYMIKETKKLFKEELFPEKNVSIAFNFGGTYVLNSDFFFERSKDILLKYREIISKRDLLYILIEKCEYKKWKKIFTKYFLSKM